MISRHVQAPGSSIAANSTTPKLRIARPTARMIRQLRYGSAAESAEVAAKPIECQAAGDRGRGMKHAAQGLVAGHIGRCFERRATA